MGWGTETRIDNIGSERVTMDGGRDEVMVSLFGHNATIPMRTAS